MKTVFLDTSYAIGLAVESDQFHSRAEEMAQEIEHKSIRCVTTWAVLLEIGNALSRSRYREHAVEMMDGLQNDPAIENDSIDAGTYDKCN
jgi:predicted nucleic acid-binding protein